MTISSRKKFGSSLNPILGKKVFPEPDKYSGSTLLNLMVQKISPGKYQPRKEFNKEGLDELANSIQSQGILQPLIVREIHKGQYEIVAGERRWRAAQMAGLQQVPAIVSHITDEEALAFGLIENIQRRDLNSIEEAIALNRLIDEFGMTHEQVSKSVGKSRSVVSNTLRLLKLSGFVQKCIMENKINVGHARSLIVLSPEQQDEICQKIIDNDYTARDAEKISRKIKDNKEISVSQAHQLSKAWEKKIEHMLNMDVTLDVHESGQGKIVIKVKNAFQIEQFIDSLS